jgi:uncharacterized membrane protein
MGTPLAAPDRPGVRIQSVVAGFLQTAFYLAYPFTVYFAYSRLGTRQLALLLLGLYAISVAVRYRGSAADLWALLRQFAGIGLLIGIAVTTGNRTVLLFLPVVVNLFLFGTFSLSLRKGPPMIERFARMVEDDLPDFTIPYCRKVTIAWCMFLASNAVFMLALALAAPLSWWALYTGLISYLVIGTLLAAEFVLRKIWFRHYGNGLANRIFRWIFPPQRTALGRRSLAYVAQRGAGNLE